MRKTMIDNREDRILLYTGQNPRLVQFYALLREARESDKDLDATGDAMKNAKGALDSDPDAFQRRLAKARVKTPEKVNGMEMTREHRLAEYFLAKKILELSYNQAKSLYELVFAEARKIRAELDEPGAEAQDIENGCELHHALIAARSIFPRHRGDWQHHLSRFKKYINEDWSHGKGAEAVERRLALIGIEGWVDSVPMKSLLPIGGRMLRPQRSIGLEPLVDQILVRLGRINGTRYRITSVLRACTEIDDEFNALERLAPDFNNEVWESQEFGPWCLGSTARGLERKILEAAVIVKSDSLPCYRPPEELWKQQYEVLHALGLYHLLLETGKEVEKLRVETEGQTGVFCGGARAYFDKAIADLFPPTPQERLAAELDLAKQVDLVLTYRESLSPDEMKEVFSRALDFGNAALVIALKHLPDSYRFQEQPDEVLQLIVLGVAKRLFDASAKLTPAQVRKTTGMELLELDAFILNGGSPRESEETIEAARKLFRWFGVTKFDEPAPFDGEDEDGHYDDR
jgi:hypothetical protein